MHEKETRQQLGFVELSGGEGRKRFGRGEIVRVPRLNVMEDQYI